MRPLFAVLIALAMLVAPVGMPSGRAQAAMPADHDAQAMDASHCAGDEGKANEPVDHSCCAPMCAGVALAPEAAPGLRVPIRGENQAAMQQFGRSHLAKLPTPPPRIA